MCWSWGQTKPMSESKSFTSFLSLSFPTSKWKAAGHILSKQCKALGPKSKNKTQTCRCNEELSLSED